VLCWRLPCREARGEPVEVAIAILYSSDRFLMQLRDNIPGIFYPGHWAFLEVTSILVRHPQQQ
jgi:hypothetical protein